jgi:hypothetical protein
MSPAKKKKRVAKSGRQRKMHVAVITASPYAEEGSLPTLKFSERITLIRPLAFAIANGKVVAIGPNAGAVREWSAVHLVITRTKEK